MILGKGHCVNESVLVNRDMNRRIVWSAQKVAVFVDVLAPLDTLLDSAGEYDIPSQDREIDIPAKFSTQLLRCDLAFAKRRPISDPSRSVLFIFFK